MSETIKNKLREIAAAMDTIDKDLLSPGILTGTSGLAMYYFHYGLFLKDDAIIDKAVDCLSLSIQKINDGFDLPTYCDGLAGVGWALMHLVEQDFIEIDCDALLVPLEKHLMISGKNFFSDGNYDFLHGGIGIGLYFLKRLESTSNEQLKAGYLSFLEHSIRELKRLSLSSPSKKGLQWHAYIDFVKGKKGINLSLSHGMSSILIFLTKMVKANILVEESTLLMKGCVDYILSCKLKENEHPNWYPNIINEADQPEKYTRVAWCYGDLGLGLGLYHAASCFQEEALKAEAHQILAASTLRKDLEETGVADAGICHGSSGLSLIYQYLYREFNDPRFEEAANYWLEKTMTLDNHPDGYAGFMQWAGKRGWEKDPGILSGIAGIGLSLLSALTPNTIHWEASLLIK